MRRAFLLALTLAATLVLPAAGAPAARTYGDPVVYIAGDSIVASWYLPARDSFTTRLGDRLCGVHCGEPGYATVVNVAQGGQRLTGPGGLQATWDSTLNATPRPTTIVLAIGINDAGLVDDNTFTSAYRDVVDRAAAAGIRVIPCLMSAVDRDLPSYNAVFGPRYWWNQWIANTYGPGVARFDWATRLPTSEDLDSWYEWCGGCPPGGRGDGLHPSRLGVVSIADAVPVDRVV